MTAPQINALRELPGVEFPPDSGAGRAGVYWFPSFMDPKTVNRSYARTGHYDGINRANYDLVADSKVTRILLEDGTAAGVIFKKTQVNVSTNYIVRARREVILAAGAIHTPQLLQLSGIGPKELLTAAGIDTVVDLPGVGQNFQDHPMLSGAVSIICRFPFSKCIWSTITDRAVKVTNFTVHPNPGDLFLDSNFSTWAQQAWKTNRTGL